MENTTWWIVFNVFIIGMLMLDLGVFHKKDKVVTFKESLGWVIFWIVLASLFNVLLYYWQGAELAFQFTTGYIIEWSLSVDNLFVFIVIFKFFKVPPMYQHRVLFWGIIGALVLRAAFIMTGIGLFNTFHWMIYVFGVVLVITALRLIFYKEEEQDLSKNLIVRLCKKFFPVTEEYHGHNFFTRINNRLYATPLFLVLMIIEFTDLLFAIDSVPAMLAISSDMFIIYTSNVFAILGLRSMYFALSGLVGIFRYLKYGISVILLFVGIKMLASAYYDISTAVTLSIVLSILAISIIASLVVKKIKK